MLRETRIKYSLFNFTHFSPAEGPHFQEKRPWGGSCGWKEEEFVQYTKKPAIKKWIPFELIRAVYIEQTLDV